MLPPKFNDNPRHRISGLLRFFALSFTLLVLIGCEKKNNAPAPHEPPAPNRTLAKVGNEDFTQSQFDVFLRERFPESSNPIPKNDRVLSELLDRAINERLFLQAAEQRQLTVADRDIQEYLANSALIQNADLAKMPAEEQQRRFGRAREILLINRYIQSVGAPQSGITVSAMKNYYETHPQEFQEPERYHVQEILVKDLALAEAIKGMLDRKRPFENLARKYSKNDMAPKNGDLGWFARGELPEQFEKVVTALKPGSYSSIVQTDYGFHIFKLKEIRKGDTVPFEKARRKIQTILMEEQKKGTVATEIARLRKSTKIVIELQNLGFSYQPERPGP